MGRIRFLRSPSGGYAVRLASGAVLAAFLLAQSWLFCLPLCVLEGHGAMTPAGSVQDIGARMHTAPCHSGVTVRHGHSAGIVLGAMLASRHTPALPPLPPRQVAMVPPAATPLQQIPTWDPPPPRSA